MATPYSWPSSPSPTAQQSDGNLARSISFGVASSPTTPLKALDPALTAAGWTAELEERLQAAQREMEAHQRKWSPRQEEYVAEVDELLELKRRCKKFARRRSKDHQREGRSLERASSSRSGREDGSPRNVEETERAAERSLSCIPRKSRPTVDDPRGRKRRPSRSGASSNQDPSPSKPETEGQGRWQRLGQSLLGFFLRPQSRSQTQQNTPAS
ncbi:MAG: hypothetical protein M1823_004715 [Watsoniomyces obsoletus]|nr:MAG: hypothetical protein M1823_004715 [Watsoniomyces obsoletus]